jgi:hypothetical protein
MFLHHVLSGGIAKTFFENSMRNFMGWPDTSHFTDKVTAECLLLATTAVKYSLNNRAGGSFRQVVFEADTNISMQNTVSVARI